MERNETTVKIDWITQSAIQKEYGWTKSIMDKMLPEPRLCTNPRYKCAPQMKLYDRNVVIAIMDTEEFKNAFAKAQKRKQGAVKAVETKTKQLEKELTEFMKTISVEVIEDAEKLQNMVLNAKAAWIKHKTYNGWNSSQYIPPEVMERWTVNYIRHNLVEYDAGLDILFGRVGTGQLYGKFKKEILRRIADAYPTYEAECLRQIKRMDGEALPTNYYVVETNNNEIEKMTTYIFYNNIVSTNTNETLIASMPQKCCEKYVRKSHDSTKAATAA